MQLKAYPWLHSSAAWIAEYETVCCRAMGVGLPLFEA